MFQSPFHQLQEEVIALRETWQEKVQNQLQNSALRGGRSGFWLSSRVHTLRGWGTRVWIKRDDELGLYGSKYRKIQGLAAAIHDQKVEALVAWGGGRSQFLLGLLSMGRELDLTMHLLVKEGSPRHPHGPDLLWPLLKGAATLETVSRSAWPQVENMARQTVDALTAQGKKVFLVREGGAQIEALWGSLTLPLDIVQQEKELGLRFTKIWVDAGTGLTAQALILGLGLLQSQIHCEILLCAGSEAEFQKDLEQRRAELSHDLQRTIPCASFRCHRPLSARSFGATNKAVFQEIQRTAQESGVLLDPIYSAKLMMAVRASQPTWSAEEKVLILHAGGTSSLFGFPNELEALTF
jgi:1-aminocyclopropane-1-carboxylate deaminase/D-cysteine desulfhydrase-like pyridoxal-dependent ACC family enzyme